MTTFPAKLAAALCEISAAVPKLGKTERNKFASYDFVSVDRFYEAIGSLMAAHGVHCIPDCIESAVVDGHVKQKDGREVKGAPLLRERWAFTLVHQSGETAGPYHRTVTVPAEGAQAHGSSESYAQKQFLRGLFRVPTGDKDDADYGAAITHAPADADPSPWLKRLESAKTPDEAREIARQARAAGLSGLALKAVMEAGAARVREMQEADDATA